MHILDRIKTKTKLIKSVAKRFTFEMAIKKVGKEAKRKTQDLLLLAQKPLMKKEAWKKAKAAQFSHWYYSTDLGDGVFWPATLPNEQTCMQGLVKNRSILMHLIDQHIGDVSGLKILDLACSAGLHSFELARRGAIVTGIDWDHGAIRQAKFVQECIKDQLRHKVKFYHLDLLDFNPPKGFFDYVYCSGLIYHLQDPIGVAQKIRSFCSRGVIISSCISPKEEPLFELSDPAQFPFCASWEFALVPTASMLQKTFEYAGFKIVRFGDMSEFSDVVWSNLTVKTSEDPVSAPKYKGPVYLVGQV